MELLNSLENTQGRGALDGHFLIAMPGMMDERFSRAVIYICAHSAEGTMGLIINREQQIRFPELLVQLGIVEEKDVIRLPERARDFMVRSGGPVDQSRGFVVHSDDYTVESSLPVDEQILLTATVDILRAISDGRGPTKGFMALGYSGWGPGQLEEEIAQNGWLTCPANREVIFDSDVNRIYDRVLLSLGIDPTHLSSDFGHA